MVKIVIWYVVIGIVMISSLRFVFLMLGPMFTRIKKAPYVPSFKSHIQLMKEKIKIKKGKKLVDLGCGDGRALRFFAKNFNTKCEGYDFNPFALQRGRILNRYYKIPKIKMIKSAFEKADLKKYDYIYVYLFPNQLADIENWIFENIKKDTIIISNSFKFAKHKPFDTIKNNKGRDIIFLYKK